MKKLRHKWLIWTSRVLSAMIALLGMASCSLFRRVMPQPLMYGVPNTQWDTIGTVDTLKQPPVFRARYGVTPVSYQQVDIDKEGVDIEIKQK